MAGQLGMLFATRTNVHSALRLGLRRNKWILRAIVIEVALLLVIVYVPYVQTAFMTASIPPYYFAALYVIAPAVLAIEELRKLVLRRVYLPARPAARYAPAPPLSMHPGPEAIGKGPFVERSPPVILPLSVARIDVDAVQISSAVCRHLGSRLIVLRLFDEDAEEWEIKKAEVQVERSTAAYDLPVSYIDVRRSGSTPISQSLLQTLDGLVAEEAPELVVVPVDHDVLVGRKRALRKVRWIERFSTSRIVLIDSSPRAGERPIAPMPRILIPILSEFPVGPFKLTEALTSNQIFPDVDVIAAKVVEMPRVVPLYSIYKPESLISREQEFSVFKALGGGPLLRYIHPMVLLVRDRSRDVLKFAREKEADLMIFQGGWELKRSGYLPKEERRIVSRSPCINLVTLFPKEERDELQTNETMSGGGAAS
ncbi:MAG: cation transporting ATPase C-terminal domain-containing protein, partial [Methanomassiliicoccales archaeon]|nr:cation transporting ATPase C-terminal domain-containing protein [Methanomassiliicoccales archaeon]